MIAEGECARVPLTLWKMQSRSSGTKVLWLVGNSSSLYALVKRAWGKVSKDRSVALVYIMCHSLHCSIYFEYVDSFSIFSGGIRRD